MERNHPHHHVEAVPKCKEDEEALSPASSIGSSASAMSLSDGSPVPSPATMSDAECSSDAMSIVSSVSSSSVSSSRKRSYTPQDLHETDSCASSGKSLRLDNEPRRLAVPKPTHKSEFDSQLQSLFHTAVLKGDPGEISQILRLHSHNIDLNKYNEEGRTPLQHFVMAGQLALVKMMVQFGADTRLRTKEGWSNLHIASFSGHIDVMAYILRCGKR